MKNKSVNRPDGLWLASSDALDSKSVFNTLEQAIEELTSGANKKYIFKGQKFLVKDDGSGNIKEYIFKDDYQDVIYDDNFEIVAPEVIPSPVPLFESITESTNEIALVPVPKTEEEKASFLRGDGKWVQEVGPTGKSAYEVAVDAGFSGTVEEWLESLRGEDGFIGADGKSAYEIANEVSENSFHSSYFAPFAPISAFLYLFSN